MRRFVSNFREDNTVQVAPIRTGHVRKTKGKGHDNVWGVAVLILILVVRGTASRKTVRNMKEIGITFC